MSRNVRIWQGRARVLALSLFGVMGVVIGTVGCGSGAPGTIGAALGQTRERRLFVRSLPPGQGAAQAGLELDDEILSIDGTGVGAMTQDDVRRAVRGPVGSTMVLKIRRTGPTGASEEREVKVVRTPLEGAASTEAPR